MPSYAKFIQWTGYNDRVYVLETDGEWAKIKLTNSSYGYLNTRYLVLVPDSQREMSIDYKADAKIREQAERVRQEEARRETTTSYEDSPRVSYTESNRSKLYLS